MTQNNFLDAIIASPSRSALGVCPITGQKVKIIVNGIDLPVITKLTPDGEIEITRLPDGDFNWIPLP